MAHLELFAFVRFTFDVFATVFKRAAATPAALARFHFPDALDSEEDASRKHGEYYYILYGCAHFLVDEVFFFFFGSSGATCVIRRLLGSRSTERVMSLIITFSCAMNSGAL